MEKNVQGKFLRVWTVFILMAMMFVVITIPAFAATNYVGKISDWIFTMLTSLCLLGTIGMAVFCGIKKEFSKMIIFLIIGAFLTFICAKPEALVSLGTSIGGTMGL